jgi:glycosyltransferase involved in cell wall biosynthesis
MRILFDTRQYVLDTEVRHLAGRHEVYILEREGLIDAGGIMEATSIPVRQPGSQIERFLARLGVEVTLPVYIANYQKIVARIQPDVLIMSDFFRLSSLQAFRYKARFPHTRLCMIAETKHMPMRWLSRLIMRVFLYVLRRHAHLLEQVIVYTEEGREFFNRYAPSCRITVSPPVIDTELFVPKRSRAFLKDNTLRILMNARYAPYKRHDLLLGVIERLVREGRSVQVTCISRDNEGMARVTERVAELGLREQVQFQGFVSKRDLAALLGEYDLLVLPSYNEALGMVVPEAMACGTPTVTSDTVGANVYVIPGQTGYVFATDNAESLHQVLQGCFNAPLLSQLGQQARTHVHDTHSSIHHKNRFERIMISPYEKA